MNQHPAFSSRPTLGQFARGGSWEHAWSFDRSSIPAPTELLSYLDATSEVAFEAFFGDAFFGVRLEGTASDVARLSSGCVASFCRASDGIEFFAALQESCGWASLGYSPSFAEVGAVNAWRSVGPFRLPPPKQALPRLEELWAGMGQTPLAHDTAHKKALEVAYEHPIKHWFALPISSYSGPNALSYTMLQQALASFSPDEGNTPSQKEVRLITTSPLNL